MIEDLFVDREEPIALFKLLLSSQPGELRRSTPIFTLVSPPGGGKSTLIEYLRSNVCHGANDGVLYPYASIDFTQLETSKDFLNILIDLRHQLASHIDSNGKHLTFPRFGLGSFFALADLTAAGTRPLHPQETQRKIDEFLSLFSGLTEISDSLGNISTNVIFGFMPFIAFALRQVETIPPLQDLIQRMKNGPALDWYKAQLSVRSDASAGEVLQRLLEMCTRGRPSRKRLLEQVLPAAFLQDIRDSLDNSRAWKSVDRAVLFLDGFEVLLDKAGGASIGINLLKALVSSEYDSSKGTDPLLIVVGSQQHLTEYGATSLEDLRLEDSRSLPIKQTESQRLLPELAARQHYDRWYNKFNVLNMEETIDPSHLYLEFWLHDFNYETTRHYVSKFNVLQSLDDPSVDLIFHLTHGYPLFLAHVVDEFASLSRRGRVPGYRDFLLIAKRTNILERFLERFSEEEVIDLTFCAVPRLLDVDILQTILHLGTGIEAQKRWKRYRQLAIFYVFDEKYLIMHPILRSLLLQQLQRSDEESDYQHIHTLLRNHFRKRAAANKEAQVEEAYHALALGNPELAIKLAIAHYENSGVLWKELLDAVAEAPTSLLNPSLEQEAKDLLQQARDKQESIRALTLYIWLFSTAKEDKLKSASLQHDMGRVYMALAHTISITQNRQNYLQQAIDYFKSALLVFDDQNTPREWASTQYDLGLAFFELSTEENDLKSARRSLRNALDVYTRRDYPDERQKIDDLLERIDNKIDDIYRLPVPTSSDPQAPTNQSVAEELTSIALPTTGSKPLTSPLPPLRPFSGFPFPPRNPKIWNWKSITIAAIIICLVFTVIGVTILNLLNSKSTPTISTSSVAIAPKLPSFPDGIGVFTAPNGEEIGISDGRFALDISTDPKTDKYRPGTTLKLQGAQELRSGNRSAAIPIWQQEVDSVDTNDAETLIYLEDQRVLSSGSPYITLVLALSLIKPFPSYLSRDLLQGTYVAQRECNKNHLLPGGKLLRILIAKSGSEPIYTTTIAEQIVQAAQKDHSILGVLGWTSTSRVLAALPILAKAHIPMISQDARGDDLTGISAYFFRLAPPNTIVASIEAKYAEQTLKARHIAIFYDPTDSNNQSRVGDFTRQLVADKQDNAIVAKETFTTGEPEKFPDLLRDALKHHIDVIYMPATSSDDIKQLLADLQKLDPSDRIQVLASEAANPLSNENSTDHPGFPRLSFTITAHPDMWSNYLSQQPAFFPEYVQAFDPYKKHQGDPYGYTRPDAYSIISYDTTIVAIRAYQLAYDAKKNSAITSDDLQQGLTRITGDQTVQGVGGQIAFGPDHDPIKKAIVILRMTPQTISIQGCYIKGCP